jgi:hypothetical protein
MTKKGENAPPNVLEAIRPKDDTILDPDQIDALRDALGHKTEFTYYLKLPGGKKLPIIVRECGIAELMEAQNGEKPTRGERPDFSSQKWRQAAIKKLNISMRSHKWMDDMSQKRPNLTNRELPFSILRGDQYNELMELAFPGYLTDSNALQERANAIRDGAFESVPSSWESDPGGSAL